MRSENTFVKKTHGEEDVKVEIWNRVQTVYSLFLLETEMGNIKKSKIRFELTIK